MIRIRRHVLRAGEDLSSLIEENRLVQVKVGIDVEISRVNPD